MLILPCLSGTVSLLLLLLLVGYAGAPCSYSRASAEVTQLGNFYSCKDNKAWTNAVRGLLTDAMTQELDKLDSTTGKQYGKIETKCSTAIDAAYDTITQPDIFHDTITKWCTSGCAPLPEDYETYWNPSYNYQSATTELTAAPIRPVKNYTVTVNCRDQFAPQNGNGQTNIAYCKSDGWEPALSNMITCASGCKDIRGKVQNGYSSDLRSTTLGGTPFNIGDVITFACNTGYTLTGDQYVTCSAIQMWTPTSLPKCVKTTTTTTTTTSSGCNVGVAVLVWGVYWSLATLVG